MAPRQKLGGKPALLTQVDDYSALEGQQILLCLCNGFARSPKAMATLQRAGSAGHSVNAFQRSGKRFGDARGVLALLGQHCAPAQALLSKS